MEACIYNYKFKTPILLNLSINKSLQGQELQKEQNILYNTMVWPAHYELSLSARSMPLQGKTSSYCCHLERGGGKRGEFDNSVRKIQHQGNKTCYKPLCHNL
jgi:hypothetical protein